MSHNISTAEASALLSHQFCEAPPRMRSKRGPTAEHPDDATTQFTFDSAGAGDFVAVLAAMRHKPASCADLDPKLLV